MRTNQFVSLPKVHNGATARLETPLQQLERAVLSCLLWEKSFYESGEDIVKRITDLCTKVKPEELALLIKKAKKDYMLRHIPLVLTLELMKTDYAKKANVIRDVCTRPDQMCELLSLYWKDGKKMLPKQMRRGFSWAFDRFDEYTLGKWNRDNPIKLRDIAFLAHIKPRPCNGALYANLVNKSHYPTCTKSSNFPVVETYALGEFEGLKTPDTWEVALSSGADKKSTWERLLNEKKLGVMAALMNAKAISELGIDKGLFATALDNNRRQLPFMYIRAAKAAPRYEDIIEKSMLEAVSKEEKLKGKTLVLVDVSGSMDAVISAKSETTRADIGAGFAMLLKEVCEHADIGSFSNTFVEVRSRRGFALRDAIMTSQGHGGTSIGASLIKALSVFLINFDRLIIITDEQSGDAIPTLYIPHKYMINIGTDKHGIALDKGWVKISGFSETSIRYICELEKTKNE